MTELSIFFIPEPTAHYLVSQTHSSCLLHFEHPMFLISSKQGKESWVLTSGWWWTDKKKVILPQVFTMYASLGSFTLYFILFPITPYKDPWVIKCHYQVWRFFLPLLICVFSLRSPVHWAISGARGSSVGHNNKMKETKTVVPPWPLSRMWEQKHI